MSADHVAHGDGCDHDHHDHHGSGGHSHSLSVDADRRYLTIALLLILGFMVFEVVAGIVAHSLALLSDAGHMLTDAGALVLSLVVIRLVQRPSGGASHTHAAGRSAEWAGERRSAARSGRARHLRRHFTACPSTRRVRGLVTIVAALGVAVNLAAAWVLAKANRQSLNIEGSFQHIVTDLYAFVGTLIAGIVIIVTGFDRADAIASLIVAGLMFRSGYVLQRKAVRVLLESAPESTAPQEVGWAMAHAQLVSQVHDLHLWELAPGVPILTAHVLVAPASDCHAIRRELERMLRESFGIEHTTLQVDHAPQQVLSITRQRAPNAQ
jgi:cobalt-zinc-cadmium efflux system protein